MKVRVLLFAGLRDLFKNGELELTLDEGSTLQDLRDKIFSNIDRKEDRWKSLCYAVNHNYTSLDTPLKEGDEVAFIPPVAGG